MAIRNAKEAYEELLVSYCELCKTEDLDKANAIAHHVCEVIELVKENYLFPVAPFGYIQYVIKAKFSEKIRLSIARELYEWLGSLMFQFEEANIHKMDPYMKALEYGRTYIPFALSQHWGEDYRRGYNFNLERFYFAYNVQIFKKDEQAYQKYAQLLRSEIHSVKSLFPKEKALPKKIKEEVTRDLNESLQAYQSYIERNYFPIRHMFSYYNTQLKLYVAKRNENMWIVMLNAYDSTTSESFVYPKEVDVMFRFHNVEAKAKRMKDGVLAEYGERRFRFSELFGEIKVHHELHRIFVKYAKDADLLEYCMYLLRGRMYEVTMANQDDEIFINEKKYLILFDDNIAESMLQEIMESGNNEYKGVILKFDPSKETMSLLSELKMKYYCIDEMGKDMINNENGEMIHLFIKERIGRLKIAKSESAQISAELLRKRLEKCPKGIEGWSEYEDIGAEIFKYLFADEFRNFKPQIQSTTQDGTLRRDLIVPNTYKAVPSFWSEMKKEYDANMIIVDFKNYLKLLNTDEYSNVNKYFGPKIGRFAIVLSRNGMDESARKFQLAKMKNEYLILCLADKDVRDMIDMKDRNSNPTDMLESMYFELCGK